MLLGLWNEEGRELDAVIYTGDDTLRREEMWINDDANDVARIRWLMKKLLVMETCRIPDVF